MCWEFCSNFARIMLKIAKIIFYYYSAPKNKPWTPSACSLHNLSALSAFPLSPGHIATRVLRFDVLGNFSAFISASLYYVKKLFYIYFYCLWHSRYLCYWILVQWGWHKDSRLAIVLYLQPLFLSFLKYLNYCVSDCFWSGLCFYQLYAIVESHFLAKSVK